MRFFRSAFAALLLLLSIGGLPGICQTEAARSDGLTRTAETEQAIQEIERIRAARLAAGVDQVLALGLPELTAPAERSLVLLNKISEPFEVRVQVLGQRGEILSIENLTVEPRRHHRLRLADRPPKKSPLAVPAAVQVHYFGDPEMLQSWLVIESVGQVTEVGLVNPTSVGTYEGLTVWDAEALSPGEGGRVAVTAHNATFDLAELSVAYSARSGEERTESFVLGGSETRRLVLPAIDSSGWLRWTYDGEPGGVVVSGIVSSGRALSALPRFSPADLSNPDGFDSLPFPAAAAGVGRSTVSLFNAGETIDEAELAILDTRGTLLHVESLELSPKEVRAVDVSDLLADMEPEALAGLEVRASLRSSAASTVPLGRSVWPQGEVVEVPWFRREVAHPNGTYPLPNLQANEVTATLLNVGGEDATVVAQVSWERGTVSLGPYTVPAGQVIHLSFDEVLQRNEKDVLGRVLEADFDAGFFKWTIRSPTPTLVARLRVRPRGSGDEYGFNCVGCCHEQPVGVLVPGGITFSVGENPFFQACEEIYTCEGTMGPYPLDSPQLTYSSPLIWTGQRIRANQPTKQDVSFEDEVGVVTWNCRETTRRISDFGPARAIQVEILNVSLPQNQIKVRLNPSNLDLTGRLKIVIENPSRKVLANEIKGPGTYTYSFGSRESYSAGLQFSRVVVTWTVDGETAERIQPYSFRVLGLWNHTRYNTATESYCAGGPTPFTHTTGTCQVVQSCDTNSNSGASVWVSEVHENGSGYHGQVGFVSRDYFCTNADFRAVPSPCPACSGLALTPGLTVARHESSGLTCGQAVFVDTVGVVTVTDRGGGLAANQLDHYAGTSGCNQVGGSIGWRMAFLMNPPPY